MECQDFEKLYWLKCYGEAVPGGEDGFLRHVETCPQCRARQQELDKLRSLLTLRAPEVAREEALQAARLRLLARLGQTQTRRSPVATVREWLARILNIRTPRWEIGLAVGALAAGLLLGRLVFQPGAPIIPSFNVTDQIQTATYQDPSEREKNLCLEEMLKGQSRITDLRIKPGSAQNGLVEVSFTAQKEFAVQGRTDDRLILELLGWAVKHEENSGVRLQSIQELAGASKLDARARQVLAWALVNDQNDGVRLKALEALGSAEKDPLVEDAILSALLKDSNPAVRIRAIDVLLAGGSAQTSAVAMLLAAAQADSNDYVSRQARRAFRETQGDYRMLEGRNQFQPDVKMQNVGKGDPK